MTAVTRSRIPPSPSVPQKNPLERMKEVEPAVKRPLDGRPRADVFAGFQSAPKPGHRPNPGPNEG